MTRPMDRDSRRSRNWRPFEHMMPPLRQRMKLFRSSKLLMKSSAQGSDLCDRDSPAGSEGVGRSSGEFVPASAGHDPRPGSGTKARWFQEVGGAGRVEDSSGYLPADESRREDHTLSATDGSRFVAVTRPRLRSDCVLRSRATLNEQEGVRRRGGANPKAEESTVPSYTARESVRNENMSDTVRKVGYYSIRSPTSPGGLQGALGPGKRRHRLARLHRLSARAPLPD